MTVESRLVVADREALGVARRQHGVVTLSQLFEVGHSPASVRHRVASGWLRRMHRGVYLVGSLEPSLARAMAAVLALGKGALISHDPAAVLWGVRPPPAHVMHVAVVARRVVGPKGVQVHRVRSLHPRDARSRHGIPVTSPARTLLDLATQATQRELDRAVNEARVTKLVSDTSLNDQFSRYPHHRGKAALERALLHEPAFTRREAERRLLELIRLARLPEPQTNQHVNGYEVDMLWPDQRLIVEVDSYAFHSSRAAFERDRRRDAHHQAAGFRTLRVTWRQIAHETSELIAILARATAGTTGAQPSPASDLPH